MMGELLNILRTVRSAMTRIGNTTIAGVPIDGVLHFIGAVILMLVCLRFLSFARSVVLVTIVLVAKEVIDVFAKSRVEYIRPPTVDFVLDLICGGLGIAVVYVFYRYRGTQL